MSEIPGLFKIRADRGEMSGLQPFSYARKTKMFSIGGKEIAVVDFDPFAYNPYIPEVGIDPEGIPPEEISDHPALLSSFSSGPIAGPALHAWAEGHPDEVGETYAVMAEAYAAFLDEPLGELAKKRDTSTHMGFNAGVGEGGGIMLQVLGNCACLGPNLYGFVIEGRFEHGYAEYDFHNADTQPQRTSLCAGMGHLARLASTEV